MCCRQFERQGIDRTIGFERLDNVVSNPVADTGAEAADAQNAGEADRVTCALAVSIAKVDGIVSGVDDDGIHALGRGQFDLLSVRDRP